MKNFSRLLIGMSLLMFSETAFSKSGPENPREVNGPQSGTKSLNVSSSPELYPLASTWVTNFNNSNPADRISLNQNVTPKAQTIEGLSLVSDENPILANNPSVWKMVVGRDVIVPVINAKNPMISLIEQQGISADKFAQLLNSPEKRTWSTLIRNGSNVIVSCYLFDNKDVVAGLERFSRTKIGPSGGASMVSATEVISAVQKDVLAIGFCRLSDLRRAGSAIGPENIRLLPIDKNGNGRLDNFEKIYGNLDEFTHGVWIGKYPGALCNNIYAISATKPTDKGELAFLSWVLGEGQNLLGSNGFCNLTSSEKNSNTASLLNIPAGDLNLTNVSSTPKSWPIAVTIILIVGLFAAIFFYSKRPNRALLQSQKIQIAPLLVNNVIDELPKGLYFDKSHTWAFMEQDGNVRVGIDDFLQHVTGKLTRIKMRETGEQVRKGEAIMTIIRDGKQLKINSPVSGTIVAQNEMLLTDSSIVNSSPFFKGWVYQIEPGNWLRETHFMLMGEKYAEWLKDEFIRLKDFIAASVRTDKLAFEHIVLQDGGELTDNVLADLGPEVWEDFQTKFIDTSR